LRFCFNLAETLGVVDPRVLYREMDSELLALWLAHFSLKNSTDPQSPDTTGDTAAMIDNQNVDQQVSQCERMLL